MSQSEAALHLCCTAEDLWWRSSIGSSVRARLFHDRTTNQRLRTPKANRYCMFVA